jgi:hypothetical protein
METFGDHRPVIGCPPPQYGVEAGDHHGGVAAAKVTHLHAEPIPEPLHRRRARFDDQLAVRISTDVKTEEVETFAEVHDARLVLVECQTSRRQPLGQLCLDLVGLLTGVTQGDQVIGVSHHDRRSGRGVSDMGAGQVPNTGSVFHPVQSDVEQQRRNHSPLRGALLGRGEPAPIQHPRF